MFFMEKILQNSNRYFYKFNNFNISTIIVLLKAEKLLSIINRLTTICKRKLMRHICYCTYRERRSHNEGRNRIQP